MPAVWLAILFATPAGADAPTCHKLDLDTEASVGLASLDDVDLQDYFACDSLGVAEADEDDLTWFSGRLPTDRLRDYRLGSFNVNGFRGGFDTWRTEDGEPPLAAIHDAYPDDDPLLLDYGVTGCFGPLSELCVRALREFRAFHGGGRDADGDRHHVDLKFRLAHADAGGDVSFWDVAGDFFQGLAGGVGEALTGWAGKPRSYCRGIDAGERQTAVDMVRTGSMAYARMRALSRRIWAAQRAGTAAAAAVGFDAGRPILEAPASAVDGATIADPVTVSFWRRQGVLRAEATDASGIGRARHDFRGPLIWVEEALRGATIRRVRVEARCRETRPKLNAREFTARWTFNANVGDADPWLKLTEFVDARDAADDPPEASRWSVVMARGDWAKLLAWDRLYALHFRHELAAIDAAFPPEARDALHLQRKFAWETPASRVLVVLRRVEFDVDRLIGQGLHRESLAFRQLLTHPRALAARLLLESSPLRKLLLCTPGPVERLRDPTPFRFDVRGRVAELCELSHKLALESAPEGFAPLEYLRVEGFVAVAWPVPQGGWRLTRFQLPNTFDGEGPWREMFTAIGQAPAGLPAGEDLFPGRVGGARPEANLAAMFAPEAAAVSTALQQALLDDSGLVKTLGAQLAFAGDADRRLEIVIGQWLQDRLAPAPAAPPELRTRFDAWRGMTPPGGDARGTAFLANDDRDKWAVLQAGDVGDAATPFRTVTLVEICRDGCGE